MPIVLIIRTSDPTVASTPSALRGTTVPQESDGINHAGLAEQERSIDNDHSYRDAVLTAEVAAVPWKLLTTLRRRKLK